MKNSYEDFFEKAQKTKGVRKSLPLVTKKVIRANKNSGSKSSKAMIVFVGLGFVLTSLGTIYFEETTKFLGRIDISLFSSALAEDHGEKKEEHSSSASEKKNDDGAKTEGKNPGSQPATAIDPEEIELNHFAKLRERKIELDKREENLNKMESEIQQQRQEVEHKLKELEDVRRKISSVLEEKVAADEQKVENLVNFYSNMKAPQAAKIIESIDEDLAVQVIAKMKKKNAADIMNLLKPEKAQSISEKYVGYKK